MNKPASTRKELAILGFVGLIFPLGMEAIGAYDLMSQSAMASWPTAAGTVLESESSSMWIPRKGKQYRVRVSCAYTVRGIAYTSDAVNISTPSEGNAGNLMRMFPKGASVAVAYNPSNPREASLLKEPNGITPYALLVCGFLLQLVAGGFLLYLKITGGKPQVEQYAPEGQAVVGPWPDAEEIPEALPVDAPVAEKRDVSAKRRTNG